jgi:hypothetical protein
VGEHRNQVAEHARQEVEKPSEESGSDTPGPHRESSSQLTGEEQAAANREEDPPA